jgi:hypothetical protein
MLNIIAIIIPHKKREEYDFISMKRKSNALVFTLLLDYMFLSIFLLVNYTSNVGTLFLVFKLYHKKAIKLHGICKKQGVAHIANPAPIYPFLIIYYSWII